MSLSISDFADLLTGFSALLIAIVASLFLRFDYQIRYRQHRESEARAAAALDVEVNVEVLPCGHAAVRQHEGWVLQTRVSVTNKSRETWCIPALYVSARALFDPHLVTPITSRFYESSVAKLPSCGFLSEPRNVARLDDSIVQISPDETESFIRWDLLDKDFVEKFPVIVVRVELFSAAVSLLGVLSSGIGPFRLRWIDYMDGIGLQEDSRHRTVVFSRAAARDGVIQRGQRVLITPGSETIDLENTRVFDQVLASIVQWSRTRTVVLRSAVADAAR